MTRKKRQQASERMKQIWAKRKAVSAVTVTGSSSNGNTMTVVTPDAYADEFDRLRKIVDLMNELSTAGKQYLVNRFM